MRKPATLIILILVSLIPQIACFALDTPSLKNDRLQLTFNPQTGGLVSLRDLVSNHDFIRQSAEKPLIWRISLQNADRKEIVLTNAEAPAPACTAKDTQLTFHWENIPLPENNGSITVEATVSLDKNADTALFNINATPSSPAFGLWDIQFPIIAPLSDAKTANVAIGRGTWGMLYEKSEETITGEYPSNNLPMQFMLLHDQTNGLYLATHDPQARYKRFSLKPGEEFRVETRAENMGVPGNTWNPPYPFVLSVYQGSWMDGCKRYRAWATKETPWTRKGPLATRKDVPENIKNVCAWLLDGGTADEAAPHISEFSGVIGAPIGVHWYNWHQIPFDTFYPNYFPTKPGFAEGVQDLVKEGATVMPYINARLWDTGAENFAEAKPAATKDEHGEVTIEEYGSGAKLAAMCPTQKLWQDKVLEIIRRLVDECHVNAVYMDQIASAPPRMCFDPSHGHPLGSGTWWVDGYREMLTPIKKFCTENGHSVGLTTENDAEPYMDNVDALLIWTPRSDHDIPINTAVYSGYTLYFATNRAFFDDASYCLCQARDFTWGAQLGWDGPDLLKPEHKEKIMFLSTLARVRAMALDFFVYGELLEVMSPTNDIPKLKGKWNTPKGDAEVTVPAVHAALWRSGKDNRLAIALANADTQPHPFSFTLDAKKCGMPADATLQIDRISLAGTHPKQKLDTLTYSDTIELPARSAQIITLTPATKP